MPDIKTGVYLLATEVDTGAADIRGRGPYISVIMLVSAVFLLLGAWLMRDMFRLPPDRDLSLDDIRPRTVVGLGIAACAMIAMWRCEGIASYLDSFL